MIDGPVGSMTGNGRAGSPMPHSDKHKQRSAATFDGDESAPINRYGGGYAPLDAARGEVQVKATRDLPKTGGPRRGSNQPGETGLV